MDERIRTLRSNLKLSQAEFADKVGLSRNYISLLELGLRTPSERTIKDIINATNCNEEWFRFGIGEMFAEKSENAILGDFIYRVLKLDESNPIKKLMLWYASYPQDKLEVYCEGYITAIETYEKENAGNESSSKQNRGDQP